jgi:hypothetical protein
MDVAMESPIPGLIPIDEETVDVIQAAFQNDEVTTLDDLTKLIHGQARSACGFDSLEAQTAVLQELVKAGLNQSYNVHGIRDAETIGTLTRILDQGNISRWVEQVEIARDAAFALMADRQKHRKVPFGVRVAQPIPVDVPQLVIAILRDAWIQ